MDRCCPQIHAAYWITESQDCRGHGSKSLLFDLDGTAAAEPSSRECCSCSTRQPIRRTDPSFQRVIRAAIDQVTASASAPAAVIGGPCEQLSSSELTTAYMQLQATVEKKLGNVDVAATMRAIEELFGATTTGIENVAFLLASPRGDTLDRSRLPVGRQAIACCVLPPASQIIGNRSNKCQIGKKVETAEDLVALLSARVDLLALQLVKDGVAITTEAAHAGFADIIMSSALSCSLLKSYDEPCEYALSSEWHWTAELLHCLGVHVQIAATYHQFWHEVHEADYWLQQSVKDLQAQFNAKSLTRADCRDVEALIADLRQSVETYLLWQTRLVALSEKARSVVPLQLRIMPLPAARATTPGRALVAYESEEVALCEGETVTLLETSTSSPLWRVRTAHGQEALVPSIIIALTSPDAAALDAALGLRQQFLALWTAHIQLLGRRLVELLSSAFTDVVVCAPSTTEQDSPREARRFRMDEQQQHKFVTVGQLLQRVLQRLGKDSAKCAQLSGLWNTLASLVGGEAAMLPEGVAATRSTAATPLLAAHLLSVEQLLIRFEDFVMYWDAYNTSLAEHQQSKRIFLAETKQFTHFITTAHYVRFYNVELLPSVAGNDGLASGDHAAIPAAVAAYGIMTDGDKNGGQHGKGPTNSGSTQALLPDSDKGAAQPTTKGACVLLPATSTGACDFSHCAVHVDYLAELKRSAFDVCEHWLQVTRLLLCQKVHLRNAAAYHEFWHEVQDAKLSLNCLLSKLLQEHAGSGRTLPRAASRAERIRGLTAEINDALNEYMLWQSKFDRLSEEARRVVPLNWRVKTGGVPLQGKVMCDYVTEEVVLTEGDSLTVLEADSALSPLWLVRTADGRNIRLPSVVILLLGPDPLALDAASRLHTQLAALWSGTARRIGSRVGALLREMLAEAMEHQVGDSKQQTSFAGSKVGRVQLGQLLGLAGLLRACCSGDCALSEKEAAALQDSIETCSAALSRADVGAANDSVDGQEIALPPVPEQDVSSLEELLRSYQDLCAYYGEYVVEVNALRQPKYVTLYNADAQRLRYITMAYFPRMCRVTLVGTGSTSEPSSHVTAGDLVGDAVVLLTAEASTDEMDADAQCITNDVDEPLLAAHADALLQAAGESMPPEALAAADNADEAPAPAVPSTPPPSPPTVGSEEQMDDMDGSSDSTDAPLPAACESAPPEVLPAVVEETDAPGTPADSVDEAPASALPSTPPPSPPPAEPEERMGDDGSSGAGCVAEAIPAIGVSAADESLANGQHDIPAEEGVDDEGSGGDGSGRKTRRVCSAGGGETELQAGEVGTIDEGTYGQGEEEEVSYYDSCTKEQQVSTEGVMESEMEVTTTFVITGVMLNPGAPDEALLSLQDALERRVIDPQNNEYVIRNGSKVTRLTIGEAMEAGYIKMGPKTERKSQEKVKSAAIITVKTIAERYPYKVISAVNTRTHSTLTESEAVAAGIIDLTKHTYRDLASNEIMLIGDAVGLHLVDILYDKNASGVIHEEVSKKFNVHSVLDERRNERVEFQVAVRRGLIDERTGSYVSSLTGQKLFAAEAIEKGFIDASVVSSNVSNGS